MFFPGRRHSKCNSTLELVSHLSHVSPLKVNKFKVKRLKSPSTLFGRAWNIYRSFPWHFLSRSFWTSFNCSHWIGSCFKYISSFIVRAQRTIGLWNRLWINVRTGWNNVGDFCISWTCMRRVGVCVMFFSQKETIKLGFIFPRFYSFCIFYCLWYRCRLKNFGWRLYGIDYHGNGTTNLMVFWTICLVPFTSSIWQSRFSGTHDFMFLGNLKWWW